MISRTMYEIAKKVTFAHYGMDAEEFSSYNVYYPSTNRFNMDVTSINGKGREAYLMPGLEPSRYLDFREIEIMDKFVDAYEARYPENIIKNIHLFDKYVGDEGMDADGVHLYAGRKAYLNKLTDASVNIYGVDQILYVGGGLSSYMLYNASVYPDISFVEASLPEENKFRRDVVNSEGFPAEYGRDLKNIKMVDIDLERTDINSLVEAGHLDPSKKTLFIFEGVMTYVSEERNRLMFEQMQHFPKGSRVFLSAVDQTHYHNELDSGIDIGREYEPYKFFKEMHQVEEMLEATGFRMTLSRNVEDFIDDSHRVGDDKVAPIIYYSGELERSKYTGKEGVPGTDITKSTTQPGINPDGIGV